ncbi:MAG TPA: 2-C-methyl-D-erythritol 2,4-cyclodiphosphate synthase [Candidatus Dormibacteraeota bacterium]|nr:2-C-methyl-D-erythritol 2,4-cyclodiphosphate synthase [Candidatus Dormibacteraeota bacterium]
MRVGIGYDVHPLVAGRPLVLGGVRVEHSRGLDGYSDADVLTHAVIDALLGAAGLGDIGRLFPAGEPKYRDASSLEMLSVTVKAVRDAGFRVVNIDCTVIAQEPRLQPYLANMQSNLAAELGDAAVNVKGKSPEGLGVLGQGGGIAAQAVATIDSL